MYEQRDGANQALYTPICIRPIIVEQAKSKQDFDSWLAHQVIENTVSKKHSSS